MFLPALSPGERGQSVWSGCPTLGLQPCASGTPASATSQLPSTPSPCSREVPAFQRDTRFSYLIETEPAPTDSHLGSEDLGALEALRPMAPCHTDSLGLSAVGGELMSWVICLYPGMCAHGLLDHEEHAS